MCKRVVDGKTTTQPQPVLDHSLGSRGCCFSPIFTHHHRQPFSNIQNNTQTMLRLVTRSCRTAPAATGPRRLQRAFLASHAQNKTGGECKWYMMMGQERKVSDLVPHHHTPHCLPP